MSPQPEEIVADKYRLVRHLARGGMGAVWRARHLELDVDVALKFIRSDTEIGERADARFRREARAAAQLKSRHVVHIYDFGSHSGTSYLAMELLEGVDLEQFLGEGGRLSMSAALAVLYGAGQGLKAVHRAGLIHRDIKPSNLFVASEGGESIIKLLDFGIAQQLDSDRSRVLKAETTAAGEVFGSPAYMSPEQARGGVLGVASDLWSLSAVFYRMLTGQSPFQGESLGDVVVKACTEDPPLASSFFEDLNGDVDEFFRRALSRDAAQRFPDVDSLLNAAFLLAPDAHASPVLGSLLTTTSPLGRSTETAPLPVFSSAVVRGVETEGADLNEGKVAHENERILKKSRVFRRVVWGAVLFFCGAGCLIWWRELSTSMNSASEEEKLLPPRSALSVSGEKQQASSQHRSGENPSIAELSTSSDVAATSSEEKLRKQPAPLSPSPIPRLPAQHSKPPPKKTDSSNGAEHQPARLSPPTPTPTDPIFGLPVAPP